MLSRLLCSFGAAVLIGAALQMIGGPTAAAAGATGCTPSTPEVSIENTFAWSQWGTWARSGDRVPFQLLVINRDSGRCKSAAINVTVSVPASFSVDLASFQLSLAPAAMVYKTVYVTSSAGSLSGDNAITAAASKAGSSGAISTFQSSYKIYSADSSAPTFYWTGPTEGSVIRGSVGLGTNATDDHMARKISLFIDGVYVAGVTNAGIDHDAHLNYTWSTKRVGKGAHVVRYEAADDAGNVGVNVVTYTVS